MQNISQTGDNSIHAEGWSIQTELRQEGLIRLIDERIPRIELVSYAYGSTKARRGQRPSTWTHSQNKEKHCPVM